MSFMLISDRGDPQSGWSTRTEHCRWSRSLKSSVWCRWARRLCF